MIHCCLYKSATYSNKKKSNLFFCDQCTFSFIWKKNLMRHKKDVHDSIDSVVFQCDQCCLAFMWKSSLKRHKKEIHEKIKYTCSTCNLSYTRYAYLKKHKCSNN